MKVILPLPLVALVCLVVSPLADAQDLKTGGSIPPAPQNHILDDTGFFRDHPEKKAEIRQSLETMEAKHGYPVYLVIYYAVIEGTLQNRAAELHRAWLGEKGQGMVLVYQRDPVTDGNNPAIAFYQGSELDQKTANEQLPKNLIPKRDAEIMLANVYSKLETPEENSVEYISEIVLGIEKELDAYFKVEPAKWNDSPNLQLMAIFAGTVAALGLIGMFLWKVFSSADSKSTRAHYFPDVKTGRRLGAPFGGGWTSEKPFPPSSSQG